jgi:cell division protein FtsI/penicillin-binding protein 2
VAFGVAILILLGRAAQLQLLEGREHAATAREQRTERVELSARRGTIYDRNGVTLALTNEVYHVGVAPNEVTDVDATVRVLVRHLREPERVVRERFRRPWAYFHGPYSAQRVEPLRAVRGVHLERELVRFHPDPDLAAGVLGRPAAPGRPASGIERMLDSLLRGTPGRAVVLRDRWGRHYQSPARLDAFPEPGHDVYLTIDAELQEIVQEALTGALERYDAAGGDIVVLNPHSGEVLAAASQRGERSNGAGVVTSVFEPGSTAKLFAAAALLTHGLVRPRDSVWTERGEYVTEHRVIHDDHPSGWLSLRGVLQESSNIGIVKFADRLSAEQQYLMLRDFGLGTPTGIEYPTESSGILRHPDQWSGTTAQSLAMGYEVAVTVLQLAQAYAAIANDGVLLQPTLVREIRTPDGAQRYRHEVEPVRRVASPEVAATLRDMLVGVVYPGGTGAPAALSTYQLAGKTGTARRAGPNGYIPNSYTASFASIFPANDPQLVTVVKLDDPQSVYATLSAAPLTRGVLEHLLSARTGAIDRARLAHRRVDERPETPIAAGTVPWVVAWPMPHTEDSLTSSVVPDLTGTTLREAAGRLHRAGLRMRIEGWGIVSGSVPAAGAVVEPGSLVTVRAGQGPQ